MTIEKLETEVVNTAKRYGAEMNGINTIQESERKGKASDLFWPWFAGNVTVLGMAYGSFLFGFGISFWQATVVGLLGVVISYGLCGAIAIAGKRGSAPTLTLSRAAFGVNGNRLPGVISWVLAVGWETVNASLAVLAAAAVFNRLGWLNGDATKVVAMIVVIALTIAAGVMGFDLLMRSQVWITWIAGVLTIIFLILTIPHIHWAKVMAMPSGPTHAAIGGFCLCVAGFGLGYTNIAADYSRYLPRQTKSRSVIGWTTFGGAIAPIVLVVFGLLLAGSSVKLSGLIGANPIGALTTILPVWFLVPYAVASILALISAAILEIYSSGLSLLAVGIRLPRPITALIDGVVMIAGVTYIAFFAPSFVAPFEAFLVTVGIPTAAWAGIFIADLLLRKKDYAEADLYDASGRYGSVRWHAIALLVVGTIVGWGMVTNSYGVPAFLNWQGYLLGVTGLGGKAGPWAYAYVGVPISLVIGFAGNLVFGRGHVRRQEAIPIEPSTMTVDYLHGTETSNA